MSSSAGASLVTMLNRSAIPSSSSYLHQQKSATTMPKNPSRNSTASTIYHSPQSSPNESLRVSPMTMFDEDNIAMNNNNNNNNNNKHNNNNNNNNNDDDDDEKPLDFSSKSSPKSSDIASADSSMLQKQLQNGHYQNRESPKLHKKVHPKFLASKRQHQDCETEHCFSTPSPSPPEQRTNTSLLADISTGKNLNGFRYNENNQLLDNTNTTKIMFEKFFKELNHSNTTDDECSANLNETFLLNQALQLAKLNCVVPGPMIMDSSSRIPDHQQAATTHLLNLITQVNQMPSNMELFKNHYQTTTPTMKSTPQSSPIKSLSTNQANSPPNSLSPSMHLPNGHQSALPNTHTKSLLPVLNGGVLLGKTPNANIEKATSLLDNVHNKTHQHNLRSSTSSKYTRPFKAYNNKDFSLLQSPTLPFPIESLASQSLLNSDSYSQFRSQMLSSKQSTGARSNRRSSSIYANGNLIGNNSIKSEPSDDNSSNSSFNGTIENMNSQSIPPIAIPDMIHSKQQTINSTTPTNGRKRGRPLPDDQKDDAYWERRRKNNEAAKRSRDLRRAKEDEIAIRACFLEKENQELKFEIIQLKLEMDKLKTLLNIHTQHSATTANSQHKSSNKGQS